MYRQQDHAQVCVPMPFPACYTAVISWPESATSKSQLFCTLRLRNDGGIYCTSFGKFSLSIYAGTACDAGTLEALVNESTGAAYSEGASSGIDGSELLLEVLLVLSVRRETDTPEALLRADKLINVNPDACVVDHGSVL